MWDLFVQLFSRTPFENDAGRERRSHRARPRLEPLEDRITPVGDWYSQNLRDNALSDLVRSANSDDGIDRGEMLDLFTQAESGGKVDRKEFNDLKKIVQDRSVIAMTADVRNLSEKVVLGDLANSKFQGNRLGDLKPNAKAERLERLVDKWFLGLDHPNAARGRGGSQPTYQEADGSLFASGGPVYTDVHQGGLGDCYFLAALAATALHDPDAISDMFIDNGDDTFTVRFFDHGRAEYLTVDRFLPVNGSGRFVYASVGDHADSDGNVLWVALAEKAYAQANASGWLDRGKPVNSYQSISGGWPAEATSQITGAAMVGASTRFLTFAELTGAFDDGDLVTIDTQYRGVDHEFVPNHAYTMIDYDAAEQTVTVYNPWGIDGYDSFDGDNDGEVTMTFNELRDNFADWGYKR